MRYETYDTSGLLDKYERTCLSNPFSLGWPSMELKDLPPSRPKVEERMEWQGAKDLLFPVFGICLKRAERASETTGFLYADSWSK